MKRLELDSHSFYSLAEQGDTNSDKEIGTLLLDVAQDSFYYLWTLCILLYACYPALTKISVDFVIIIKIMRWEGIKKLSNYILMQTLFVVFNNVEGSDLIMPCFLLFYLESIGAVQ